MSKDLLTFREKWNGPSFLERSPTSHRMKERDETGKTAKKTGKEHYRKDWDKDLWD